jgi:tetratricopeptide (TPR) repeat protein
LSVAIAYFERHLHQCPQNAYAWRRLVDLYGMVGRWSEAEDRCRRWLDVDPEAVTAWQQLGQILWAQGEVWPALLAFKTGLEQHQRAVGDRVDAASHATLVAAIAEVGDQLRHQHQWKAAADAYQLALKLQVDRADWHMHRAQALIALQDWSSAIVAAKAAIALDLTCAPAYYWLGQAASQKQDWPLAALAYGRAIAQGHASPWAWVHWAEALAAQARWSEAAEAYRQVCNRPGTQPLPARIYQSQASILERLGDWPALLHHSQQAIAHYPQDSALRRSLALAHHRLEHHETAIATYQQLLQQSPTPWLHNTLAQLLLQQGNCDAAGHHYDQAIALKTNWDATFHRTWGQTWANLARTSRPAQRDTAWTRAIAATQAALAQGLGHADQIQAYVLLSQGHQQQEDWDAAIAAQQQAYQLVTAPAAPPSPGHQAASAPLISGWLPNPNIGSPCTAPALGLRLADLWMQAQQPQQAAPLYWQYLPSSRPAILGYGVVSWQTWQRAIAALAHQPAAATVIARQALRLAPDDVIRQFQLAECLVAQQAFTSATPLYRHILDQLPDIGDPQTHPNHYDPIDLLPIDLLRRLVTAECAGREWSAACQTYTRLAQAEKPLTSADYEAWGAAAEQLEDWDQAIACYTQATQTFPQETEFHRRLGDMYAKTNNHLAAATAYERAIRQDPKRAAATYLNWCNAWQKAGRLSNLHSALQTSIQRHPLHAQFREQLGRLYLRQGQIGPAVMALWQAVALDPDATNATIELVRQLFQLQAGAVALAVYEQASDRGLRLPAYLHRQCADWLIAQDPDNIEPLKQAQIILERAIAQHPKHGRLRGALGMVLAQQGDQGGAIAALEAGLALEPDAASLHQTWGDYWQQWGGDPQKAQDCYRQARSLDPDYWVK